METNLVKQESSTKQQQTPWCPKDLTSQQNLQKSKEQQINQQIMTSDHSLIAVEVPNNPPVDNGDLNQSQKYNECTQTKHQNIPDQQFPIQVSQYDQSTTICMQTGVTQEEIEHLVQKKQEKAQEQQATNLQQPRNTANSSQQKQLQQPRRHPPKNPNQIVRFPNNVKILLLLGQHKLICEDCLYVGDNQLSQIKLFVTTYRIAFIGERSIRLDVPLGFINKLSRTTQNKPAVCSYIELFMKNGLEYRIKFISSIEISQKIFNIIGKMCYFSIVDGFAFTHCKALNPQNNQDLDKATIRNGWNYNMKHQFQRLGLELDDKSSDSPWTLVSNNSGKLCLSYPEDIIIPAKLGEEALQKCLKYRCKQRIPILAYAYSLNHSQRQFACLWRGSQPKLINQSSNRHFADEQYIKLLGTQKPQEVQQKSKKNLVVYDIKVKQLMNLMSNNKSFNILTNYKNGIPKIVELPSISATRQAYLKAVQSSQSVDPTKWLSSFQQSKWMEQNFTILNQSFNIANNLENGYNVLVQCCDGLDRTSQLSALSQIILDPYYRTLKGFAVLVQKQFVSTGYPFGLRLGWKKDKEKEDQKSPIFIQFLDCVYQMICAYPLSFEYTGAYLANLSWQLYSNRFGNFLCNSYQQQLQNRIFSDSVSIWRFLSEQQNQLSINPYYSSPQQTDIYQLKQRVGFKEFVFWKQHFSKFYKEKNREESQNQIEVNQENHLRFFHFNIKRQTQRFKELLGQQYLTINNLRDALQIIQ